MKNFNLPPASRTITLIIFIALTSPVLSKEIRSEFSIRWNPEKGGPRSTADVVSALNLQGKSTERDRYEVHYFRIQEKNQKPEGTHLIARKRTNIGSQKKELMLKYRATHELGQHYQKYAKNCPLLPLANKEKDFDAKYEADISFVAENQISTAYSLSCTVDSKEGSFDFPKNLTKSSKPARTAIMSRTRIKEIEIDDKTIKEIKIEEWEKSGKLDLIEISWNGHETGRDMNWFNEKIALPLIKLNTPPLSGNKSD